MKERGFTIVELLLACLILSTICTSAAFVVNRIAGQYRLESASRAFLTEAAAARSLAMSRNLAIGIQVHPDGVRYGLVPSPGNTPPLWNALPKGVFFSRVPGRTVTFYSRGTATPAGSFIIANSQGSLKVVIALSGRTRWERID